MPELRFAIFASGRGSNAVALMDAFASRFLPAELAVVIANKEGAPVLDAARERKVPSQCIVSKGIPREEHERHMLDALAQHRVDHILLAGYMRILSPYFLREFNGRILNIHPALLPDFPGLHAAERQWEAGRKVAGATIHFVDEGVDTGETLLNGSIEVRGDEGPEGLASRILHEVEHTIYPRAVRLFIDRLQSTESDQPS